MPYYVEIPKEDTDEYSSSGPYEDREKAERVARRASRKTDYSTYVVIGVPPIGHKAFYSGYVDHTDGDYA